MELYWEQVTVFWSCLPMFLLTISRVVDLQEVLISCYHWWCRLMWKMIHFLVSWTQLVQSYKANNQNFEVGPELYSKPFKLSQTVSLWLCSFYEAIYEKEKCNFHNIMFLTRHLHCFHSVLGSIQKMQSMLQKSSVKVSVWNTAIWNIGCY